ncbi:DUF6065 family protein [Hyphobacterium sp.]|uniref:DUF6065 family protein n=1 Tax=Hyphobacterium sp. TaxID=2004662 RepID=UPI0037483AA6
MKLTLYPLSTEMPPVRPADPRRQWMDDTPESFAYRCLPLALANQHGWEVTTPVGFTATWNGGNLPEDVKIEFDTPPAQNLTGAPLANFGSGVLTFELHFLLRTPPGWNIFVTGPMNGIKHGIAPLSGVIETDWSPYTFTMNWRFTAPDCPVRFEAGEAVAHFFPVRRDLFEKFEPALDHLNRDPKAYEQFMQWRDSRQDFAKRLSEHEADAVEEKWQKTYYRGLRPDGSAGVKDHKIKLRAKPFEKPSR